VANNPPDNILVELCLTEFSFCNNAASFLQTAFWGSFKGRFGWKPFAFSAEWKQTAQNGDQDASFPLLALYRKLGPGIGFAYIPWGPELPPPTTNSADGDAANSASGDNATTTEYATALGLALRSFLPKNTAFIRFDFPWTAAATIKKPFVRAAANVQPPDTVLVNLIPDEKTILANMKSKWRYNIGLAEKKGVNVRAACASAKTADSADNNITSFLDIFYHLYKETAERDRISIHPKEYYTAFFEEAANHAIDARLYLASHEGETLAAIITVFRGGTATYLYGASSNNKRNLMAPYALQWQAMKDAKAAGCQDYDMFGIPPLPPEELPDHPMAGLYRFKTGFIGDEQEGGRIVHRPGCWDYPCRPLIKALYSAAEKTRKTLWDIKKRLKRTRS
jgi:lipid II:glycine glycyltransferase (peptidoglycan interpeptide bridge formation enzyme)